MEFLHCVDHYDCCMCLLRWPDQKSNLWSQKHLRAAFDLGHTKLQIRLHTNLLCCLTHEIELAVPNFLLEQAVKNMLKNLLKTAAYTLSWSNAEHQVSFRYVKK